MSRRSISSAALALVALAIGLVSAAGAADGQRVFELRIYTAADGKLEALHGRFREHTVELFKKHGMEVIGFWSPVGEKAGNTLVYLLAYPSQQARETMWKAFTDDPEWKRVYAESQQDGTLVTKVESTMLEPTDYSPLK